MCPEKSGTFFSNCAEPSCGSFGSDSLAPQEVVPTKMLIELPGDKRKQIRERGSSWDWPRIVQESETMRQMLPSLCGLEVLGGGGQWDTEL